MTITPKARYYPDYRKDKWDFGKSKTLIPKPKLLYSASSGKVYTVGADAFEVLDIKIYAIEKVCVANGDDRVKLIEGEPPTFTTLVGEMWIKFPAEFIQVITEEDLDWSHPVNIEWSGGYARDAWIARLTPEGHCEFIPAHVGIKEKVGAHV